MAEHTVKAFVRFSRSRFCLFMPDVSFLPGPFLSGRTFSASSAVFAENCHPFTFSRVP